MGAGVPAIQGLVGNRARAATPSGASVEDTKALAISYFSSRGYEAAVPKPIITGADYNGGLNYDEDGFGTGSKRSLYVVQPCARVEDAKARGKAGTLPVFTLFAICPAETETAQRRTSDLLEFLTAGAGLDPKRHVEIDSKYFRPAEVDHLIGDATKGRTQLGWEPAVSFEQLIAMMVDADLARLRPLATSATR